MTARYDKPTNTKFQDLTGKSFGRLLVVNFHKIENKRVYWNCRCSCGNFSVAEGMCLKSGNTSSCGCLAIEMLVARRKTHGGTCGGKSIEYKTWINLKKRCKNINSKDYADYGGRGIKICERWESSFENFLKDMAIRPKGKYSIDRLDVNGDYEPKNCRWATDKEQGRNKTNNHYIQYNGNIKTLAEWSEITGLKSETIRNRLKIGWSESDAVSIPVRKIRNRKMY